MSPSDQESLEYFVSAIRWRRKLAEWRGEREDRGLDDDVLAKGTNGRLFLPEEVFPCIEPRTLEAYIFHKKEISYQISYLDYVPESRSVVVVMHDETRLDLGVKLRWWARPHFMKAEQVKIVRAEDGKVLGTVVVPLRKGA